MRKLLQFRKSIKNAKSLMKVKPFIVVYEDEPCDTSKYQEIRIRFL